MLPLAAADCCKEPADCQIEAAGAVLDSHHHGAACLETAKATGLQDWQALTAEKSSDWVCFRIPVYVKHTCSLHLPCLCCLLNLHPKTYSQSITLKI